MSKLAIPANALLVGIGVTLILGFGVVTSLISSVSRASNEGAQVQPTPTGNTMEAHSPTQAK